MYISTMVDNADVRVNVRTATDYKQVNGEYRDVDSVSDVWLMVKIGYLDINLRMTRDQLDSMRQLIASAQQAHAEEDWHPDTVVRIAE